MVYEIDTDMRANRRNGGLFCAVRYWNSPADKTDNPSRPRHTEDFQVTNRVGLYPVNDARGFWKRISDDEWVDPATFGDEGVDVSLYERENRRTFPVEQQSASLRKAIAVHWRLFESRRTAGNPLRQDNRMPTNRMSEQARDAGSDPDGELDDLNMAGESREVIDP